MDNACRRRTPAASAGRRGKTIPTSTSSATSTTPRCRRREASGSCPMVLAVLLPAPGPPPSAVGDGAARGSCRWALGAGHQDAPLHGRRGRLRRRRTRAARRRPRTLAGARRERRGALRRNRAPAAEPAPATHAPQRRTRLPRARARPGRAGGLRAADRRGARRAGWARTARYTRGRRFRTPARRSSCSSRRSFMARRGRASTSPSGHGGASRSCGPAG